MSIIYICTAIHNELGYAEKLIKSILKNKYINYKIIVADNGSTDGATKIIRKKYPQVLIVEGDNSVLWTGGLNLAINEAMKAADKKDYVLTINTDCTIPSNYLELIYKRAKISKNIVCGSVEIDYKTRKPRAGYLYANWSKGEWINDLTLNKGIQEVDWLTTKGTITNVGLIRKNGVLNQRIFPHYASDVEWTSRLKKSGAKLIIDPNIKLYSDVSHTGISYGNLPNKISIKYAYKLLFSRKSSVNLIDHFNLIKNVCPPELRLKNYLRLFEKIIYTVKLILK